jgi:diadenosine tetraphosphate (Ap4A) HIT family hydrolase
LKIFRFIANLTVETEHALAFSDGYPVAQGHTLVIPRQHVVSIFDLAPVVQTAVWDLAAQVARRAPAANERAATVIIESNPIIATSSAGCARCRVHERRQRRGQ